MASTVVPKLPVDNVRALEQLRQRLSLLSTSLTSLVDTLERNDLPTWSSLQAAAQVVSIQLEEVQTAIAEKQDFFKAAHVFPLTTFPAHTQENMLNELLRKRLQPSTEDWIKRYGTNGTSRNISTTQSNEELRELWSSASLFSKDLVVDWIKANQFEDEFTIAEKEMGIENIETGLRRKFWEEDEDEDDAQDEDKMEDVQISSKRTSADGFEIDPSRPAMSVEQILRVLSTGRSPAG